MTLAIGTLSKDFTRIVEGISDKGGEIWRDTTGHERDMALIEHNYGHKQSFIARPFDDPNEPPNRNNGLRIAGYDPVTIEGREMARFLLIDASVDTRSDSYWQFTIPAEGAETAGHIQRGCVNIVRYYLSSPEITLEGELGERHLWGKLSFTDEVSLGATFQVCFRLGLGADEWQLESEAFNYANRKITKNTSRTGVSKGGNIHAAFGSKTLRSVKIRPVEASDGIPTYELALGFFCPYITATTGPVITIEPVALNENEAPEFVALELETGGTISTFKTDNALTGIVICSVPFIASGPIVDGAIDLAGAIADTAERVSLRVDAQEEALRRVRDSYPTPNEDILSRQIVRFNNHDWENQSGATKKIPALAADLTETWLTANGFAKIDDYVIKGEDGTEWLISSTDLDGVDVSTTAKVAAWVKDGQDTVFYHRNGTKWAKDVIDLAVAKEVSEIVDRTIPSPVWPLVPVPANLDGSFWVRRGEMSNVAATMMPNVYAGTHMFTATITDQRNSTLIARAGIPADNLSGTLRLRLQTGDGIELAEAFLQHNGTAWVSNLGTVTLDNGFAIVSFPVKFAAAANTVVWCWFTPGDVLRPAFYAPDRAEYVSSVKGLRVAAGQTSIDLPLDLPNRVKTLEGTQIAPERISALEAKLNNLTPINVYGGDTRPDATPFVTIPDRTGARFNTIEFTARDGRKNSAGGWSYADRATRVSVPVEWLSMDAVAGRTGWTAETFATRNSLKRRFNYGTNANYDFWLQWRRNGDSWDIWFQGQHTSTDTKPLNQYCAVTDIVVSYIRDDSVVDPGLKPITNRLDALEAKPSVDIAPLTNRVKTLEDTVFKVAYTPPASLVGTNITAGPSFVTGPNGEPTFSPAATGANIPLAFDTIDGATYTIRLAVRTAAGAQIIRFYDATGASFATTGGLPVNGIKASVSGDWTTLSFTFTGNGQRYDRFIQTTGDGIFVLLPVVWEPAPQSVDLTPYAKKADLAVKRGRAKAWSPALTDLTVTLGQAQTDTSGLLPPSADIDAPVFTVVPAAAGVRAARVRFTIPNLVAGQEYELVAEVGIGINTGFVFEGGTAVTVDGTNWRRYTLTIKPTATTYSGAYTVLYGATVHGPALYFMPGLYVRDKDLVDYRVAEPSDVKAAQDAAFTGINALNDSRITPLAARVAVLEGVSGGKRANPAWFAAPRDFDTAYLCKVVSGKQAKSISFDFCGAGETATVMSMTLDTKDWTMSGYWGGPAKFINVTPPNGTALTIAVVAYTDGSVNIGVGPTGASFSPVGKVRNVIIDGIIADTL